MKDTFFKFIIFAFLSWLCCSCSDFSSDTIPECPRNYQSTINKQLQALNRQINEYPLKPRAYYLRAGIYKTKNKTDSSYNDINKAIHIDSANAAYYLLKAELENRLQFYNEALTSINKAENADDGRKYLVKAVAYHHTGAFKQSQKSLDQYLRYKPFNGKAYLYKGKNFLALKDSSQAIAAFKQVIRKAPSNMEARYALIDYYLNQEKYDQALEIIASSLNYTRTGELFYNKANILKQQGNIQQAFEFYNKAIAIDPEYVPALYQAGLIQYKKYRNRNAFTYMSKVDSLRQGYKENNYHLGVLYYRLKQNQKSYEVLGRIAEDSPNYGKAQWFIKYRVGYNARQNQEELKQKQQEQQEQNLQNNDQPKQDTSNAGSTN